MEDILAIILIFGGGTAVAVSFSPIGRAFADRIRGRSHVAETDPELLAEMDDMRSQLSELQERVDFTERLLSKERAAKGLSAGGDA